MHNPYLYEKLAQAHRQELLQEAEQQRMLAQLPRRHPQLMQNIARQLVAFLMSFPVESRYVVPPCSMKVSGSRTGQEASILKLAPGLLSKGEGQLIGRKGEQVSEFAHEIGFR
jgi:hypothetical protein